MHFSSSFKMDTLEELKNRIEEGVCAFWFGTS